MAFYDLSKEERQQLIAEIYQNLLADLQAGTTGNFLQYFSDKDKDKEKKKDKDKAQSEE